MIEGEGELLPLHLPRLLMNSVSSATSASVMQSPLTAIRSVNKIRWGDVYVPSGSPPLSVSNNMEATEPFPLVPAMWTAFRESSGLPRRPRNPRNLLQDRKPCQTSQGRTGNREFGCLFHTAIRERILCKCCLSCFLGDMRSIMPSSSRYSDLWNPCGGGSTFIILITLDPAKPIMALAQPIMISPSMAMLRALTEGGVGHDADVGDPLAF